VPALLSWFRVKGNEGADGLHSSMLLQDILFLCSFTMSFMMAYARLIFCSGVLYVISLIVCCTSVLGKCFSFPIFKLPVKLKKKISYNTSY